MIVIAAFEFGRTIHAIELPPQGAPTAEGVMAAVGWGWQTENIPKITEILRVVTLPIMSNANCNKSYEEGIEDQQLCAGLPEGGCDSCNSDSGGPLVVDGVLHGIVSWGKGCARPHYPGVYTRVSHFVNWIRSVQWIQHWIFVRASFVVCMIFWTYRKINHYRTLNLIMNYEPWTSVKSSVKK